MSLRISLWQDKVEPALEMSKRGGYLWILLERPLLAKDCRIYIHDLASRLGVPVRAGLADGIEIFPRHNAIAEGEFGNAIRGSLGIHRGASRRFWFYGADYTLEAQMAYLNRLRKLTEEELQTFITGKEVLLLSASEQRLKSEPRMERGGQTGRSEFRSLDHLGKVRKLGGNYISRCPSCADSGHDRSADNLAVLIQDPRFYKCWAGCTKEMILAVLGHPIRIRTKEIGELLG